MTLELPENPLSAAIGLEVHAQLQTASKMFCGCSAAYAGVAPNTHVCAVCAGMPGALPVINERAVLQSLRTALALGCSIPARSKFDRKNYSYPDLPKGYQISQYDLPLGQSGVLEFLSGGSTARCGVIRVHLEEDTGKSLHRSLNGRDVTLLDYNRSGVALMEIVSQPDLISPEQARDFFAALRQLLVYLDVNDGNLQEGSMRADVNVSVRDAAGLLGTKVEIKNLNSFRAVQRSLEFELERQKTVISDGGRVEQETRGWSEQLEVTLPQRSKEYAHDYRYFPEPDLPTLSLTDGYVDRLRATIPELPLTRRRRFEHQYDLDDKIAQVLTSHRSQADFFEAAIASNERPRPAVFANWITGDLTRLLNESGTSLEQCNVSPSGLATLLSALESNQISGNAAKKVLEIMFSTGDDPLVVVQRENLELMNDSRLLDNLVSDVLRTNEELVAIYRGGKLNAVQALVGKVMAAGKGKANPRLVRKVLEDRLRTSDD